MRTALKIGLALACIAAFGAGGAALAGAFDGDDGGAVSGPDATRAGEAAVRAVGGGEVAEVERSDDRGSTWEVEVRKDGRELEVHLDRRLEAVSTERGD